MLNICIGHGIVAVCIALYVGCATGWHTVGCLYRQLQQVKVSMSEVFKVAQITFVKYLYIRVRQTWNLLFQPH